MSNISPERTAVRELGPCEAKIGGTFLYSRPTKPRKGRLVQLVAFALALVVVVGTGLGVFALVKKGTDKEKATLAAPMFMTHSPILIEGEAELTESNGVTGGNGTAGNPYVIQGWDINASGTTTVAMAGIAVANITSDLVIKNVNVHSGGSNNVGIGLYNLTNCTVEYSQSTDNLDGIVAVMCGDVVIQNNTVENNTDGGITVWNSNHTWVAHDIAVDNLGVGIGMYTSMGSSVADNTMSFNNNSGLDMMDCSMTTVFGNIMDNNSIGLMMIASNWSQINNNKIVRNLDDGVEMLGCQNNTLFSNMIADTSGGQMFSGYGAYLSFCTNNAIYHNDFLDNYMSPQAADDSYGGSSTNHWNMSYPTGGNYWSDYSGSDGNHDGIGDTPYDIYDIFKFQLTTHDNYPLMTARTYGNGPTAFFTVTPASGPASTIFTFNASLCWDCVNRTSELQVRWDFNSDGAWDTGWSTNKIIQHSYAQAGEYNVTMEVKNGPGQTSNMTWHVEVEQLVIPEFTTLLVPICSMMALFLVIVPLKRRR